MAIPMGEGIRAVMDIHAERPVPGVCIGLHFHAHNGQRLFSLRSSLADQHYHLSPGLTTVICEIPELPLIAGHYDVHGVIWDDQDVFDMMDNVTALEVSPADVFGTGRPLYPHDGSCFVRSNWSVGETIRMVLSPRGSR